MPQIIFSNKHELRGIDLVTRDVKSFISSLKNTVTLDFYHAIDGTDTLYWTDVVDDKIFKGTIIDGCMSRRTQIYIYIQIIILIINYLNFSIN